MSSGGVRAGALPVPRTWLSGAISAPSQARNAGRSLADQVRDVIQAVVLEGHSTQVPNVFYWPSGDIPFEIVDLTLGNGVLTLQLVPLRR